MDSASNPGEQVPSLRRDDRLAILMISGVCMVIGVITALAAQKLPRFAMGNDVGPAAFPTFYSAILIALSVLLAVQTWRAPVLAANVSGDRAKPDYLAVVLSFAISVGYAIGIEMIGFLPATFVALIAMMMLLGRRDFILTILLAACLSGAIYMLFSWLLLVPLPTGSLFE